MKAGIAIDDWKLSIFDKHLTNAGYVYEKGQGVTPNTLFLTVETDDLAALQPVIMAANTAAAKRSIRS